MDIHDTTGIVYVYVLTRARAEAIGAVYSFQANDLLGISTSFQAFKMSNLARTKIMELRNTGYWKSEEVPSDKEDGHIRSFCKRAACIRHSMFLVSSGATKDTCLIFHD